MGCRRCCRCDEDSEEREEVVEVVEAPPPPPEPPVRGWWLGLVMFALFCAIGIAMGGLGG